MNEFPGGLRTIPFYICFHADANIARVTFQCSCCLRVAFGAGLPGYRALKFFNCSLRWRQHGSQEERSSIDRQSSVYTDRQLEATASQFSLSAVEDKMAPPMKPPPGVDIDLQDKDVQKAAAMIQKSFRGHRVRKKLLEDGPPKFLDELVDVDLVEGSATRLDCRLGGFPDPTVTWFKDNQELKEGVKYRIIFEDPDICALVICNGSLGDDGSYTCKAYNQFGEAFDTAKVTVKVPAKIEKGPPNMSVKVGSTITLQATVGGEPEPDIGWAKGDEDIDEDDRVFYDIKDDVTTLTIKRCTKKDAGKYECYVENEYGSDHTFSRVEVK